MEEYTRIVLMGENRRILYEKKINHLYKDNFNIKSDASVSGSV